MTTMSATLRDTAKEKRKKGEEEEPQHHRKKVEGVGMGHVDTADRPVAVLGPCREAVQGMSGTS